MPERDAASLVTLIHGAPIRLVLAITGGGSRAIAELLEVPGGSRTLLEAVVPYSSKALEDWLGSAPEQFCSSRTARAMAMAAYSRGRELLAPESAAAQESHPTLVGVGCTASLVSDRPKRGAHRVHVAWQSGSTTASYSIELVKGRRHRIEEEAAASRIVLNAIADAAGLPNRLDIGNLGDEPLEHERIDAPALWQALLAGKLTGVRHENNVFPPVVGLLYSDSGAWTGQRAIFPGAFNPLHNGHRQMIELAANTLGVPVDIEISIENVDKPSLDFIEMDRRLRQFERQTVWFTRAPTFVQKTALFPGATFVVGADTMRRIADRRYYCGDPAAAAAAIDIIAQRGTRFLVFGRERDGRLETLSQLDLPANLRELCTQVPIEQFRLDISSTSLRNQNAD
jgi:nicotinic acid mononucleotide adenylyltransferase